MWFSSNEWCNFWASKMILHTCAKAFHQDEESFCIYNEKNKKWIRELKLLFRLARLLLTPPSILSLSPPHSHFILVEVLELMKKNSEKHKINFISPPQHNRSACICMYTQQSQMKNETGWAVFGHYDVSWRGKAIKSLSSLARPVYCLLILSVVFFE